MNSNRFGFVKELPLIVVLLLPFIILAIVWSSLPTRVPMHFDLRGNVNRYGSPWELLILPGVNIFVALILYFIPRLDPNQKNIEQSLSAYRWIRISVATMFAFFFALMLIKTFHPTFDDTPLIVIGLLALFFMVGFAMPRLKQNYMIGIRLPWTLESEDNWNRTHAFAGRLWPLGSIMGIVLVILFPSVSLFIIIGVLLAMVVWTIVYSYRLFKREKRSSQS